MPRKSDAKVNEKSTKLELWQAYNEAVAEISGEKLVMQDDNFVNSAIKNLPDAKLRINTEIDELQRQLLTDFNHLNETIEKVRKDKRVALEKFDEQRKTLDDEMAKVRERWAVEQKLAEEEKKVQAVELEKTRKRETEDYEYNLSLSRKKEADLWEAKEAERERSLAEKEAKITARSAEILAMEKELSELPARIDKEIKLACDTLRKDLSQTYENTIKELKMQKEHEKGLADIKIANLELSVKNQTEEIESLKKQLHSNNMILKEMAVVAIEAKGGKFKTSVAESNL